MLDSEVSLALEDYLVTIYRLEEVLGVAKTTHLAVELKVRPATVAKIIKRLEENGFVARSKYRGVKLTSKGRRIAEPIVRRHRILESYLAKELDFDQYNAHELAHKLEHMPKELIDKIYEKAGKPKYCPHGNPVSTLLKVRDKSLLEVSHDSWYEIVRIAGELKSALSKLKMYNLHIGSIVRVVERTSKSLKVEIRNAGMAELDLLTSATLRVRKLSV